ncbi:MAG: Rieske (2Fe-2S) protein [Planctomycetota bacterium]|nr:Rieske (2Fe-2S) protein [Planctomycetota bacterium]
MNDREMSRRDVLNWLAAAAATGWMLDACAWGEEKDEKSKRPPKLASLMALPNDSAKGIDEPKVIVVRTAKGVAAFPRVCTHRHQELDVDEKDGSIYCPLHGSRFSLEGKPTNGPASRALKWYKVELDQDGSVRVDTRKNVDAGAWAPLPDWAKPKSGK